MGTATSFAGLLRQTRERAGVSQTALARRAGITAPYLSLLEGGKRRPPSPARVERLAKALGVEPGPLLDLAALERSPAPIRRRIESLDRERGSLGRTRDRLLTTTLFRVARTPGLLESVSDGPEGEWPFLNLLTRLAGKLSGMRSVREAQSRSEEILERVSPREREELIESLPDLLAAGPQPPPPPVAADAVNLEVRTGLSEGAPTLERVALDARWAHAGAFLWRLSGDDGWPRLESGDLLLIDTTRAPRVSDLVALRHQGRDLVRRLERLGADEVRLESLRPDHPPLRLPAASFAPTGVVVRVIRALV